MMQSTETVDLPDARYVKSYAARLTYKGEIQYPPEVPGVQDAIDVHCHAHEGQQDALALAKHASRNGMRGILFKTIAGRDKPAYSIRKLQNQLNQWCEIEGISPITCWAGYLSRQRFLFFQACLLRVCKWPIKLYRTRGLNPRV